MFSKIFSIAIAFLLLIASCKEEVPEMNDPISVVPYLEIRSVSATSIVEYEDSIVFEIFYQDGDGDIGFASPDSLSMYVTDSRIFTVEDYYIPLLAPEGANISIQGIFPVTIDRTIMIDDSNASETVQFKFQIIDRAGNYSNIVTSQVITVLPD